MTQIAAERQALLAGIPVRERELAPAGIPTTVLEGGEGPPLVLLHGPGGSAAHWFGVLPALTGRRHVVAPDLPGQGRSSAGDAELDEARVLRWLAELIEQTCADAPVLVGNALGGAIAARFAVAHGDRVARLVLVDALGLVPFAPEPGFGAALHAYLAGPDQATHDGLWEQCAHDLGTLRERMPWAPFAAYNVERAQTPAMQAALGALMERFGLPAIPDGELARISVPTTLIWGRHDRATPLAVAEAVHDRHGWPLYVIDDAADDPPVERPDAFVRALASAIGP